MAGGRRFTPPISARQQDAEADRVRRNADERITEIQKVPIVGGFLVRGVKLPDATNVPVHHGLGRQVVALPGVPYALSGSVTTGGILRDRTRLLENYDARQYVVLYAEGWGTTMYVDLWIF